MEIVMQKHFILSDLAQDMLARTLTVEELRDAYVINARDVADDTLFPDMAHVEQFTVVSRNLLGGFGAVTSAALETLRAGDIPPQAALHIVFHGDMTEEEGTTARRTAQAWAQHMGFAQCMVSLRTHQFDVLPLPVPAQAAPKKVAWLLGASGQDGTAAGRAMREVSRLSRLTGTHALVCGDQPLSDTDAEAFACADAVVVGFSLYKDMIPAYMLVHLRQLAATPGAPGRRLYVVVCGACNKDASALALERLQHFAVRAGFTWGQGLALSDTLLPATPAAMLKRTARTALFRLARSLARGAAGRNAFAATWLPKLTPSNRWPAPRLCAPGLLNGQ
jgi:hypothetical protein